jgi:hypothetical protein
VATFSPSAAPLELYNVVVEDSHDYFVGDDAMLVHKGPGFIKTPVDAEFRPLTQVEAEAVWCSLRWPPRVIGLHSNTSRQAVRAGLR